MKKFKSGVLVVTLLLLLTGCVKSNGKLIINDDKSMNLTVDLLLQDKYTTMLKESGFDLDETLNDEEFKKNIPEGFAVNKKTVDGFSGIELVGNHNNIDELSCNEAHRLWHEELKKEAGDILWQLSGLCKVMGWNLEDVAQMNLDKLAARKKIGTIDGNGDGIERSK